MSKNKKWRVGLCKSVYYSIEVDATHEEEAICRAYEEFINNPNENITSDQEIFTGIFVDDSNKNDKSYFYPYVKDIYEDLGIH